MFILIVYVIAFGWHARQLLQHVNKVPARTEHANIYRPLNLGDSDFLGARRIAARLTRFLTNVETEPPLTLAITGDWGSGKSSLMNFLFANLKRQGWRPVWFNAWHYQNEQNVLISIITNIHKQAVEPWWHPAGFWLRLGLVWRRHTLWKVSSLLYVFANV